MAAANGRLNQTAFLLFALAVALLPLGLGGNRLIPFSIFQGTLLISTALLMLERHALLNTPWPRALCFAMYGLVLVIIWAVIQALPILPHDMAHDIWSKARSTLGIETYPSIAFDRYATVNAIMRFSTYVLTGLLAYVFAQNKERTKQLLTMIAAVGMVIALYGLWLNITGSYRILAWPKMAHITDLTGTFIDRNHFAVYAGMVLLIITGLLWQHLRRHAFSAVHLLTAAVAVILSIALCLSHSRAGLLATLAGLCMFVFAYLWYQQRRRLAIIIPAALACCIALFFAMGGHQLGRFETLFTDFSSLDRAKVYSATVHAICQQPLTGYGFGNFESAFPLFRTSDIAMAFNHAHSDWLESVFDLGVPFALILWASIALLLFVLLRGVHVRRQTGLYPALALASSCIVLLHSMVEFSLQMPGITCLWACLLGLGIAHSYRTDAHDRI